MVIFIKYCYYMDHYFYLNLLIQDVKFITVIILYLNHQKDRYYYLNLLTKVIINFQYKFFEHLDHHRDDFQDH